ncbi:hypothetical protein POPTR_010G136601v4 [Populus trichocarpa]|uniref:Uncharacterized protein n=1 Tax=Populus trichocarpa TaxID=3694 RepID=A0ACC0SD81_POPTR|nr:hypothetical protein POPTR_010G136601v4 [Populus trichocarpa]
MALPATMKVLGLGLGIGLIVFVAVLTDCSTYGGLMGDAFGNVGRRVLQIFVMLNNVRVLIVYMIIIADVLSGTSSCGVHHAGALEETTDSLRYTSALAVALAVVFLVITAGITAVILVNGSANMPSVFTVVPILDTVFICHFNLEDSSMIQPVVQTSLALCSAVHIMTSFFGFLLFGDSTLDDMLANFDTDLGVPYSSLLNDIVCISYALHLMLVFHVIFHPLRLNLDGLLFPSATPLVSDNHSIRVAFQFTGATSAACLGFIFLAAIALRDPHFAAAKKDKVMSVLVIFLALFSSLVAIYSDACALFRRNPSPHA